MQRENKRFFLDLKENERGRFLRISQSVSFGQRSQVAIPASGIKELIAAVIDLLTHFGPEDLGGKCRSDFLCSCDCCVLN